MQQFLLCFVGIVFFDRVGCFIGNVLHCVQEVTGWMFQLVHGGSVMFSWVSSVRQVKRQYSALIGHRHFCANTSACSG